MTDNNHDMELKEAIREEHFIMRREFPESKLGDYRFGDDKPELLRQRIVVKYNKPEWGCVPLSYIRGQVHNSTGDTAKKVGKKKRGGNGTEIDQLYRLAKQDSKRERPDNPQYEAYISSVAWSDRRKKHLEDVEYHCQLCSLLFPGRLLQVHHVRYPQLGNKTTWGTEHWRDLLAVCVPCHKVADLMRRQGVKREVEYRELGGLLK